MIRTTIKVMVSLLFALSMSTGKATASTVSYDLTGDPHLGVWGGVALVRVTLTDVAGGVDFIVAPLINSTRLAQFGFNFLNDAQPAGFAITSLGAAWKYGVNINKQSGFNGFGNFDVDVKDGGQAGRLSLLTFSITGGTALDYVAATNKDSLFSAHVTDLNSLGGGSCSVQGVADGICTAVTGYAGDGTLVPPAAVPVPAAVWLFGSGLLGLVGIARRKAA